MLKRTIKYEDFDGNEREEVFYFNISKPELIELEVDHPKGFGVWMDEVMKAKDNKTLMEQFKRIVLLAYGEKSDDGRQFVKTPELREKFASSAAYISLFTELATDDKAAVEFLLGALPRDMTEESRKKMEAVELPEAAPTPSV
jgi:hypothetical protein